MAFLGIGVVSFVVALFIMLFGVALSIPYISLINMVLFPLAGICIVLGIVFIVLKR